MLKKEIIEHNIYTISLYSNQTVIKIFIGIATAIIFFWILSASAPQLVQDKQLGNKWCQDKLNFQGFVQNDFTTFSNKISSNMLCFLCMKDIPITVPYGIAIVSAGEIKFEYPYLQPLPSILSIITSEKQIGEQCLKEGLEYTTLKLFPQIIDKEQLQVNNLTLLSDYQSDVISWDCQKNDEAQAWFCKSKQLVMQSSKKYGSILLYQQISSIEFVKSNAIVEYFLLEYNEKYFIYNEVLFIIWIGLELLFFLLVFLLKDDGKMKDKFILVATERNYKSISLALFLNNDWLFPFQAFHDTEGLRLIHMICQSASLTYLFYYIFTGLRNIIAREVQVSLLNKLTDLIIGAIFYLGLINIQIRMESILAERIIHDAYTQGLFSDLNSELLLVQLGISLLSSYFMVKIFYTSYLQMTRQITQRENGYGNIYCKFFYKEYQFNRSCNMFVLYSFIFGIALLSRLIYQYMIVLSIELVYFDQVNTVLINLYFFLLWWLFDQENQNKIPKQNLEREEFEINVNPYWIAPSTQETVNRKLDQQDLQTFNQEFMKDIELVER